MRTSAGLAPIVAVLLAFATGLADAEPAGPSRPAFKGCAWERVVRYSFVPNPLFDEKTLQPIPSQ